MSNNTALATITGGAQLAPVDPMTLARAFKESGFFPDIKSEAQAVVKIVAGQEYGIGPMAAMQGIVLIQGKIGFSAGLVGGLIKRRGSRYNYLVKVSTADLCQIEFFEDGKPVGISSFTKEDAQKAGLWGKGGPWQQYPKAMLFNRALTSGARMYCPDIFMGAAYTQEELAPGVPTDEDGVIIGEVREVEPITPALTVPTEAMPMQQFTGTPEVLDPREMQVRRVQAAAKRLKLNAENIDTAFMVVCGVKDRTRANVDQLRDVADFLGPFNQRADALQALANPPAVIVKNTDLFGEEENRAPIVYEGDN